MYIIELKTKCKVSKKYILGNIIILIGYIFLLANIMIQRLYKKNNYDTML